MVTTREVLEVLLKVKDETRGRLGQFAGELGRVGQIAGTAVVAGFAAAAAAAGYFMAQAIMAGAEAEEMLSKFGVTFGDQAEALGSDLDRFAVRVGRSRYELRTMAADMGAVLKGMGLGESVAAELSSTMTQLAVDVGSFNNLPSADVAHRFQTALTGEFESLKALGIVINQTRLQQELLNMGVTAGINEVDQATKAQAIHNLILQSAADAIGDAERTSYSWTNQMVAMRARISDLKTDIGLGLIPVFTPLLGVFNQMAGDAIPALVGWFEDNLVPVLEKVVGVLVALFDAGWQSTEMWEALSYAIGEEAAGKVLEAIGIMQTFIDETVIPFVEEHGPALEAAILAIGTALAIAGIARTVWQIGSTFGKLFSVVGVIIAIIGLLAMAWTENWGGIRDKVLEVWAWLQPILANLWSWLSTNIPIAIETLKTFWEETLLPAIQNVWAFIQENVIPIFQRVWEWLATHIPAAIQAVSDFWNNVLLPAIQMVWSWLSQHVFPLFQAVARFLRAVFSKALEIVAGVWQNILQPAIEAVWGVIQDVWGYIREKLQPVFEWVADFIENTLGPIFEWLSDVVLDGLKWALDAIGGILDGITDAFNWLADAIENIRLPDWLMPGSPTPLELGLRGILGTMDQLQRMGMPGVLGAPGAMLAGVAAGGGRAGGGRIVVANVHVDYRPMMSMGDVADFESRVLPLIREGLRLEEK